MINEVLLTSENFVRNLTNIDGNVQSKFLLSAIRESQEVELQQVIGTNMLNKLKGLVEDGTIEETEPYKNLLNECQLFLAYQSIVQLCLISTVKISNGGLQQTTDENLQVLDLQDTFTLQNHYQDKADFFRRRLQGYILDHKAELPEISQNKCNDMYAELHSAASTSLWLGGKRGKNNHRKCCKR